MQRRTKIICTLGPASNDADTIRRLIEAGMDIARLNFSHGSHADHRKLITTVRREAEAAGCTIPILQDLQGPKIRIGKMTRGGVLLHKGQTLVLTSEPIEESDAHRVHVSYDGLAEDLDVGGRILIDDGQIELQVTAIAGDNVETEVIVGGPLRSKKGVNLPHIRSSSPSLTDKDISDLKFGLQEEVDLIALSFVRTEQDVLDLLRRVRESGKQVRVIAKIEKPEAVDDFDDILANADGIMVARGDLGIEMPMQRVPIVQKAIIRKCLASAKPVITATQMLDSMIENPRPTRAEASDVANAVLDGSDALMLSGETAAGKYPVRAVEVMAEIIRYAEQRGDAFADARIQAQAMVSAQIDQVGEAVAYTAVQLAEQTGAVAIACLTHSGSTARRIARYRPHVPVYGFTDEPRVVAQLGLTWGTQGFAIPFQSHTDEGVEVVLETLRARGIAQPGDRVVLTAGMPLPAHGTTNMVEVATV